MPYDQRAREDAGIAYHRAVANLKRTFSDPDIEYLYQQQPVGIDTKGRIILRPENGAAKPPAHSSELFEAVSSEIALHSRHNLVNGVCIQFSSHSCEKYSPYKDTLYLPRYFINMTLPHRKVSDIVFKRVNGKQTLKLRADDEIGLPYGVYARLVLLYVTTERVRKKEREFKLGASWSKFLEKMQINKNGPRNQAVQEQLKRLCATTYHIIDKSRVQQGNNQIRKKEAFSSLLVAEKWMRSDKGVEVTLSPGFFLMTSDSVVPLESRIVHKLRRSPLSLDLYAWLSYRLFTLKEEQFIPWKGLEGQFGSHYGRPVDFRKKFRSSLESVLIHTPPSPVVDVRNMGLHLSPGAPSDVEWMERMIARARSSTRFPLMI
ncbi:MAG: replication protein RepA [Bryobacterales bacterium]|nr:replication protein RepA [Bryobacterales bacterium]MDE0434213.1 replication protein RepA [Bryobacterales bacterium]